MSARARVVTVVALAAVAAAAATAGVTYLQTRGQGTSAPGAVGKPKPGAPPLELDFGTRDDAQTRALARAAALYGKNRRAAAGAIFSRYSSLDARIGSAFAAWPHGSLDEVKRLVAAHPHSSLAVLHLGLAYYWSGRNADAVDAWRRAETLQPDTRSAIDAESLLYAGRALPGRPPFVPPYGVPEAIQRLPAGEELAALARAARRPDARAKLLYGTALQHLGRSVSAERQFAAAAAVSPRDPVAQTAAAVGLFTKANPVRAFGRLGPLTGEFPKAAVVRFHLGLLLLWTGERSKGTRQMRLAAAQDPRSPYAREARAFLTRLASNGTK
jgi:tetratricopeptide (TPR) repeat protein